MADLMVERGLFLTLWVTAPFLVGFIAGYLLCHLSRVASRRRTGG